MKKRINQIKYSVLSALELLINAPEQKLSKRETYNHSEFRDKESIRIFLYHPSLSQTSSISGSSY
jgi:hypothetical protein